MYIAPISANYKNVNSNYQKAYAAAPKFKGVLPKAPVEDVLNILSKKNIEVVDNFNINNLTSYIGDMIKKYRAEGINSAGIQLIEKESEFAKLLGKDAAKYDTKGKVGICIAVGENSSIDKMNKIYEAKTVLVKKSDLF